MSSLSVEQNWATPPLSRIKAASLNGATEITLDQGEYGQLQGQLGSGVEYDAKPEELPDGVVGQLLGVTILVA